MTRPLAALMLIAAGCVAAPAARSQATNRIEGVVVVAGPGPTVQSGYPSATTTSRPVRPARQTRP